MKSVIGKLKKEGIFGGEDCLCNYVITIDEITPASGLRKRSMGSLLSLLLIGRSEL